MDEGTIRMQAEMFALVADMEAIKLRSTGMEVANSSTIFYGEVAFIELQQELEEIARRLREEI